MKKLLMVASTVLLAASVCYAQCPTATADLAVTVGAEAAIQEVSSGPLISTGTTFSNYTSTTDLTYWVRTTSGGGGTITVKITTDFSTGGSGGGPSVTTPPTPGDLLTYTCTAAAPVTGTANPCGSAQTASTVTDTNVVTFLGSTQSAKAGDDFKTMWTLTNDPSYLAGTYTAVATYTISAT
jgi:hypothetical protein